MNVHTITGNLGRDARLNSVNGKNGPISVLNFTVAVRKSQKDQNGNYLTLWVDCALWGTRADSLAQYMTKGVKVSVSGESDVETYESNGEIKAKMVMRVNDVDLSGRLDGGHGQNNTKGQAQQNHQPQGSGYQQPNGGGYQQPHGAQYQQPAAGYQQGPGGYQQPQGGYQQPPQQLMQQPPQQQHQSPPVNSFDDFGDDVPF